MIGCDLKFSMTVELSAGEVFRGCGLVEVIVSLFWDSRGRDIVSDPSQELEAFCSLQYYYATGF